MTFCSLFISYTVSKNETVENGKKQQDFYLFKMIKTTLLAKITAISQSQPSLNTIKEGLLDLEPEVCCNNKEKPSLVPTLLPGISLFQGK